MSICSARRSWWLRSPSKAQPAGRCICRPATDWYNYWTSERVHGGQTIKVDAPIDTLPLFVRAGSIVPLGDAPVNSTNETQKIGQVRVYPGADGDFTLYSDDGKTYAYETRGRQDHAAALGRCRGEIDRDSARHDSRDRTLTPSTGR